MPDILPFPLKIKGENYAHEVGNIVQWVRYCPSIRNWTWIPSIHVQKLTLAVHACDPITGEWGQRNSGHSPSANLARVWSSVGSGFSHRPWLRQTKGWLGSEEEDRGCQPLASMWEHTWEHLLKHASSHLTHTHAHIHAHTYTSMHIHLQSRDDFHNIFKKQLIGQEALRLTSSQGDFIEEICLLRLASKWFQEWLYLPLITESQSSDSDR